MEGSLTVGQRIDKIRDEADELLGRLEGDVDSCEVLEVVLQLGDPPAGLAAIPVAYRPRPGQHALVMFRALGEELSAIGRAILAADGEEADGTDPWIGELKYLISLFMKSRWNN